MQHQKPAARMAWQRFAYRVTGSRDLPRPGMVGGKTTPTSRRSELPKPTLLRKALLAALLELASVQTAHAADWSVSNETTLSNAIQNAANGDRIIFTADITLATNDLAAVQKNLTIDGAGHTLDGAATYRGLFLYSGTTTVSNLTIQNTVARGGNGGSGYDGGGGGGAGLGGALFVAQGASLTVSNVSIQNSKAVGGNGGNGAGLSGLQGGGGGGGGLGGNGANGTNAGGGGGGGVGIHANGGNNSAAGGAGIIVGAASGGTSLTGGGANGGGGGGGDDDADMPGGGGGGVGGGNVTTISRDPGAGGFGGGGGGSANTRGGNGGFGGGGGSNRSYGSVGNGGFGGGGGGASANDGGASGGSGGFGGGNAGLNWNYPNGGGAGGGGAMGGAIFVMEGGTLTVDGNFNVNGGSVVAGAGGVGAGNGSAYGTGLFLQGNGTLTFQPASGVTQTVSDVIADQTGSGGTGANAGSWSLLKSGAGVLVLQAANTYSGGTEVQSGTLQIGSGGTSGSLGGGTVAISSGATLKFDRSDTFTVPNTITGAAGSTLVQAGSGDTILTGTNTYSGGTEVQSGTLQIGSGGTSGSLGGGTVAISSGATLKFDRSDTFTVPNTITGAAGSTLVQAGSGDTILTGTNTYSGGTDVQSGTLQIGSGGTSGSLGGGTVAISSGATLKFDRSDTFTVANTITGAAGSTLVQAGSGNTILTGTNTYSGGTDVQSGTLQIGSGGTSGSLGGGTVSVSSGATLKFDRSNAFTVTNAITGAAGSTLVQAGSGNTILTGASSFNGTANVNAGVLSVNGSLAGTTNVNNGGTLGGSGSVGNVNVLAGGTLAPGNSIGTLTVNGNLSFAAGATYRVETDAAGHADKTVVNGDLSLAGNLSVQAGSGNYARNTSYTILTYSGVQTGAFDGLSSNLAFLTPTVAYNPNSVVLTLTRNDLSYAAVAQSLNQTAVANYLNGFGSGAGNTQMAALVSQIENLTAGQARSAFDSLSGSQHASGSQVAQGMGNAFGQGLFGHLANSNLGGGNFGGSGNGLTGSLPWGLAVDAPAQVAGLFGSGSGLTVSGTAGARRETGAAASGDTTSLWGFNPNASGGLWGQALGGGGHVNSDGNGAASTYRSGGFLVGADQALSPSLLVGAAAGYQRANWDANTNGNGTASGRVETPVAALYARYTSGPWMIAASGSYADNKFATSRNVVIGGSAYTAASTHHGGEWGANLQAELALAAGSWEVRPLAGLRYARLKEDAFTESGAGVANLSVDARASSNTTASIGVKGLRRYGGTGSEGSFEARLIASHLYGDNNTPVSARLAGQSASFISTGTPLRRDALTFGVGVSRRLAKRVSGYADASIEARGSGQSAYALTAGLRWQW